MEPLRSPASESRGVKEAPFTYSRRRQSVFDTGENLADATRATRSLAERPVGVPKKRHRMHARRSSRLGGHAMDITAAVRDRARLSSVFDGNLLQLAAAAAASADGRLTSTSVSVSPYTLSANFPSLKVAPVPGCLRVLRYTRSTRAWDTLASGCLAEAAHLSEKDNDVVAWAACFILSGDAERGLTLLESYVVATCVVVHEVLTGALRRLPKNRNIFSQRRGGTGAASPQDEMATPYMERKCLERHNQVLMTWMRYRTSSAEKLPAELVSYDVNILRTPEAAVRQVVLMSMTLIDAIEVQRWYIVALVLFAPVHGSGGSGDSASGQGARRTRRKDAYSTSTGDRHRHNSRHRKTNGDSDRDRAVGAKKRDPNGPTGADLVSDMDSIFSQTRSMHSASSTAAAVGDGGGGKHTSASDGYRAPQNLWFRYFFALDECGAAGEGSRNSDASSNSNKSNCIHSRDGDKSVTTLAPNGYNRNNNNTAHRGGNGAGGASGAARTSFGARRQKSKDIDVPDSVSSRRTNGLGRATPVVVENPQHQRRGSPFSSASFDSADEGSKDGGRKSSAGFQSPGKLARTLSWFRDRNRGTTSQTGRNDAANASFLNGASPSMIDAPTWHLSATVSLDQEQTCSLLLSHMEEWDVYFITAMTAFYTHHYRTSMMAASRFLHWAEMHGGIRGSGGDDANSSNAPSRVDQPGNINSIFTPINSGGFRGSTVSGAVGSSPLQFFTVPGLQRYQHRLALFMRAWAALQIGERLQAGKDIIALLEEKDNSLSYHVGCALGLYGLPLPEARDTVLAAAHAFTNAKVRTAGPGTPSVTSFSTSLQGYLYLLAEAVHATTLLQLGLVRPATEVAKAALQRVETCKLTEEDTLPLGALRDVLVIAATAMEDSNAILDVPLSAHRLVYLAVCPAFFGGLCANGIRVKAHSATHRTLYPQNLPLYASTRQVIPFHMNRAMFLYHAKQIDSAWDDACCAVAAADEVVGSVEFAFSDCFPLRVYNFAVIIGLQLLGKLLAADLEAAKACLANPDDQKTMEEKDIRLQEDEQLGKEIVHICQEIVQRMQHFFPHSRVTELCRAQVSIVCGGKDYLAQAVALSRRYPYSPATQNVLTLALYFDHHIPEAVDNARKNLQTFPHSSEVISLHRMLQKKHVTYNFNYRKLLPTQYKPGSHGRVFTKRMIIVLILLAANLVVLCLTAYVNVPSVRNMPDGLRYLAVRMQLPTVVPLFFAAIFVIHAIVAAVTTKNLIATLLTDLFFVNTPLNRALFCLRCIPLINFIDALLISILGNNFLFESGSATFVLYFFLAILFVPFTTRIWFLPSIDEPDVGLMSWLAILSVDTVVAIFIVVPHIITAFLEPFMLVLFYFFAPAERPSNDKGFQPPSSSIRRRLLLHAHDSKSMPQRFTTGSGSHFIHVVILKWLYAWSHCTMETRFLAEAQLEAECYRVFPLFEGDAADVLYAQVSQAPLCAPITTIEKGTGSASSSKRTSAEVADGQLSHPQQPQPLQSTQRVAAATIARRQRKSLVFPCGASYPSSPSSLSSSSASSSSSPSGSDSGSLSHSDSESLDFDFTAGRDMEGNKDDKRAGNDDSGDSDFDGTLLAGVRTVDAMRQLLKSTAGDRPAAMLHTASFVRPNMLHSFGSVFARSNTGRHSNSNANHNSTNRNGSSSSGDEEGGNAEESAMEGHDAKYSSMNANRDATTGRGGTMAATPRLSDNIFGTRAETHPSPNDRRGSSGGNHSNSGDSFDVASYHEAYEEMGLLHRHSGSNANTSTNVSSDGEVAAFPYNVSVAGADSSAGEALTSSDAKYLYTDDYAAQNGFGWY